MRHYYEFTLWGRLERLEKRAWEHARRTSARRGIVSSRLSEKAEARLDRLWEMREQGLTEADQEELFTLLRKCQVQTPHDVDACEDDDDDDYDQKEHNLQKNSEGMLGTDADPSTTDIEADENDEQDDDDYYETVVNWDPMELAFVISFHRYAFQNSEIAFPDWGNLLHEFLVRTGRRLFEKYGWSVGQDSCSTIVALDEWQRYDREILIKLYASSG
jgi:hypothetical protein